MNNDQNTFPLSFVYRRQVAPNDKLIIQGICPKDWADFFLPPKSRWSFHKSPRRLGVTLRNFHGLNAFPQGQQGLRLLGKAV